MNRDTASAFLREIQASNAEPIEPVFLDYSKDMGKTTAKSGIPVLYKQNTTNDLFSLRSVVQNGMLIPIQAFQPVNQIFRFQLFQLCCGKDIPGR